MTIILLGIIDLISWPRAILIVKSVRTWGLFTSGVDVNINIAMPRILPES